MVSGWIEKPFELEAQDSGNKECPITYKACTGEQVVLSGGRRLYPDWRVRNYLRSDKMQLTLKTKKTIRKEI